MHRLLCICSIAYVFLYVSEETCYTAQTAASGGGHVQYAIRDGHIQSKGVNLGGWLVAEHWMTPQSDIWKNVDQDAVDHGEYQALTNFSSSSASSDEESLRAETIPSFDWHHENFITGEDIESIASFGFNTVRVPVGYWITGFDNYDVSGQEQWKKYASDELDYLDQLIRDWGKRSNVSVMISMHAAKGSQSGAEHSSPESYGKSFFGSYPENIQSTLEAVVFLADRYKYDDAFLGIGLLNEPSGSTTNEVLYEYYQSAYNRIRNIGQNTCILTVAPLLWEQGPNHVLDLLPGAFNVWVEWHRYFIWGYADYTADDIITKAMEAFRTDIQQWKINSDKKLYIGEWTFANTGQFKDKESLQTFAAKQMEVLTNDIDGGWAYWSWRTYGDEEGLSPWSARNMVRNGIFPPL